MIRLTRPVLLVTLVTLWAGCISLTHADTTYVPQQFILKDPRWNPGGSPYVIQGVVGVFTNMTILPGVTILLDSGASMEFSEGGNLSAAGTVDSPIVFESYPGAEHKWKGLYFEGCSSGIMKHCTFRGAGHTSYYGARCNLYLTGGRYPTLDSCVIADAEMGAYAYRSTATVSNTEFLGNGTALYCYQSAMTFRNCLFKDNRQYGIIFDTTSTGLVGDTAPYMCRFLNNGIYDIYCHSTGTIRARHNFWGAYDSAAIALRILDSQENDSVGPVLFMPFELLDHDAVVSRIVSPDSVVLFGAALEPKAVVRNSGNNLDTIPVICRIDWAYRDSTSVTVMPGDSVIVTFAPWTPETTGSYVLHLYAALATEGYCANDTVHWPIRCAVDTAAPEVDYVTPGSGGNTGLKALNVVGHHFEPGVRAVLLSADSDTIKPVANRTYFLGPDSILAVFDLDGVPVGNYDIAVINPNARHSVRPSAFAVEAGVKSVSVTIVGQDEIKAMRPVPYVVSCVNLGNDDIDQAVLIISASPAASLYSNAALAWPTGSLDTIAGVSLAFTICDLKAGESRQIPLWLTTPGEGHFSLEAQLWTDPDEQSAAGYESVREEVCSNESDNSVPQFSWPPLEPYGKNGRVVFQLYFDCSGNIVGHEGIICQDSATSIWYVWENLPPNSASTPADPGGTRLTPWLDFCKRTYDWPTFAHSGWQEIFNPGLSPSAQDSLLVWIRKHAAPPFGDESIPWGAGLTYKCTEAVHDAFSLGAKQPLTTVTHHRWDSPSYDYYLLTGRTSGASVLQTPDRATCWGIPATYVPALRELLPSECNTQATIELEAGTAGSPNNKTGPKGVGTARYIASGDIMTYVIGFERDPSASTPAGTVSIRDTLSPNLDWSTVTFNATYPGSGPDSLRPAYHEQHFVDPATGVVTWTLSDINLPPDTAPYWGQGWVSYSVKSRAGLASGTTITNRAWIQFDADSWFSVPSAGGAFSNTMDAAAPTSRITALNVTSPARFDISWSGNDEPNGSGIATYSIYFGTDSLHYSPWIMDTAGTHGTFVGQAGHKYYFYSIATDRVGHTESGKTACDAWISAQGCCTGNRGNVDGKGIIDLSDLSALVSYLTGGGFTLSCTDAANVNGAGIVDLSDLSALVSYLTGGGFVLPKCP